MEFILGETRSEVALKAQNTLTREDETDGMLHRRLPGVSY